MARYAYVDNNEIVELVDQLPKSWKNYSNFDLMDPQSLFELGWLPVDESQVVVPPFNGLAERAVVNYEITPSGVRAFVTIVPHDSTSEQEVRQAYMAALRDRRNSKLQQCDWTVLPDSIESRGQQWKEQWASYRQTLRDFPSFYETVPLSDLPDIDSILWPIPPAV